MYKRLVLPRYMDNTSVWLEHTGYKWNRYTISLGGIETWLSRSLSVANLEFAKTRKQLIVQKIEPVSLGRPFKDARFQGLGGGLVGGIRMGG